MAKTTNSKRLLTDRKGRSLSASARRPSMPKALASRSAQGAAYLRQPSGGRKITTFKAFVRRGG
jgi:hypothetical protein